MQLLENHHHHMTAKPFKIPEGLNRNTVESLERIRVMARERILEYREKKRLAQVRINGGSPVSPITNPRGCPND
jgi:hypothetical protein